MIIEHSKMSFFWVSDFYDLPLKGICKIKNEIHYFEIHEHDEEFIFYKVSFLSFLNKMKWLYKKRSFELMVGYHWSYRDGKREGYFFYRKPVFLYKLLYNIYYLKPFKKIRQLLARPTGIN